MLFKRFKSAKSALESAAWYRNGSASSRKMEDGSGGKRRAFGEGGEGSGGVLLVTLLSLALIV